MSDPADPGQPSPQVPPPRRGRPRAALGLALLVLGLAGLLWGVLEVTTAGFGTEPAQGFAQRRSYDRVKTDVHEVFPSALLRAVIGLALLYGGLYLLGRPTPDEHRDP